MNTRTSTAIAISILGLSLAAGAQANHHCANAASMKFKAQENHISLDETKPLCVSVDENNQVDATFVIQIVGNPNFDPGIISVMEKNPESGVTIRREGTDPNILEIHVQGTPPAGEEWFDYWIEADKVGKLDPKVRVVGSPELQSHQADVLKETLDANGISVEEATSLLRTIKP